MRCTNNRSRIFRYLLIIFCLLPLSFKPFAKGETKKEVLPGDQPLRVIFKTGLLSLEAKGVKAEEIFKEISEKCGVEIRNYGNVFPPDLINISFSNLELKKGIKRAIKAAGIRNHSMLYREVKPGQYQVYAIDFLGESKGSIKGKSSLERFSKEAAQRHTKKQISREVKEKEDFSQGNFEEKMEEFKDKYQWDSSDTQELAGYLLEAMPEKIREAGLDEIANRLDKKVKEGSEAMVDEEMFLRAIEETVPPRVAPKMIGHVRKQINEFKGEEVYEIPEELSGELKQDFSNKRQRKTH